MKNTNALNLLVPVILFITVACSAPAKEKIETFIVPERVKPVIDTGSSSEPPPPPAIQSYYLPFNFIVDSVGNLYFYQLQRHRFYCGTGIDWDTPPEFLDLRPADIVQVPSDQMEQFVKLNIFSHDSEDRQIAIAAFTDTIESAGITQMMALLKDTANHCRWFLRMVTQEERVVLDYKKSDRYYDAGMINWDSSKTRFPLQIDEMMRFNPPVNNDQ
jgi:hypothetical protein